MLHRRKSYTEKRVFHCICMFHIVSALSDRTKIDYVPKELLYLVDIYIFFISHKFTIYSTKGATCKYVVKKHLCGAIIQ
jgi:hypothetical protein